MTACATCDGLGDTLTVNTGRDARFPDSFGRLKALWNDTGMGAFDALQCPTCGAWFEWRDHSQLTGSGNNDEETLDRLPPEAWHLFERLLHGDVPDDAAALVKTVFNSRWEGLFLRAMGSLTLETWERLAPAMVERFVTTRSDTENHSLYGSLYGYAGLARRKPTRRRQCEHLAGLLRREADQGRLAGRAKYLLELCERALSSPGPSR
ncbi:MAG: hypothetical protein AB1938_18505 [Myxococcota bacterium]